MMHAATGIKPGGVHIPAFMAESSAINASPAKASDTVTGLRLALTLHQLSAGRPCESRDP